MKTNNLWNIIWRNVDADFGDDKETRRSTTGFLILINSAQTSWFSQFHHYVSVSTVESDYYGTNEYTRHCLWYRNILKELESNMNIYLSMLIIKQQIDNCEMESFNPESKHIDLMYHSIRELVRNNYIDL